MKQLSKNESGFGAMGVVLVVVVVILIGVAGWLVYKHDHKSPPASTTNSLSTSKQSSSSQQSRISTANVTQLVTNFYERYKSCSSYSVCETDTVKQYGTANLLSYYQPKTGHYPEDPILCAQGVPVGFVVLGVTTTPTTASGTVAERFDANVSDVKFTITDSGGLKIDTITCNPPAKATTVPN